jgi:hypothetical protein
MATDRLAPSVASFTTTISEEAMSTTGRDARSGRSRTWFTAGDAALAIRDELGRGDTNFALRTLARALADLRALVDGDDIAAFLAEPPATGSLRWDTLLAAAVGGECRQLCIPGPAWTNPPPLDSWWFPVFDPLLAARTIQRTPIDLSLRGIWLDGRALQVV